jgi:hypothetical protein
MADLNPSDYTIDELEDELASIDDSDTLHELLEDEANGDNRTGANEAIEQRLQVVEDEDENEETDVNADTETETEADESARDASTATSTQSDDIGIIEIRDRVRDRTPELIGRELDGIIEIQPDDDGWTATVEIVERRSIPDTQDILGRYEIQLDGAGTIRGYRRLSRYRRDETTPSE